MFTYTHAPRNAWWCVTGNAVFHCDDFRYFCKKSLMGSFFSALNTYTYYIIYKHFVYLVLGTCQISKLLSRSLKVHDTLT